MRVGPVISLLVAAGLLVAAVLLRSPGASPGSAPAAPVVAALDVPADVTVKHLMAAVIDPAADALWGRQGTVITKDGEQDLSPKTDAEWAELVAPAERIVQAARLLADGHRARDQFEWLRVSRDLETAGEGLIRAVKAKNAQTFFDAGEGLYEACDGCHKRYWSIEDQIVSAAAEAAAEAATTK